ncbi:MAG: response regulator [Chloroflexi bacterium]|nr:response regulator [Chloroflexota bacterium]
MSTLKGKRIFIVEDNLTNMAVFATALRREGAEIIQDSWNTGSVDLLIQNLPVDLIILDLMLRRGLSGYDTITAVKAHPELAHIPVVAISSLDAETEIPKAKEKGFIGFISKPINLLQFPKQIAACIEGQQVWVTSHSR